MPQKRSTGTTARAGKARSGAPLLTEQDLFLFNEGTHLRLWEKLGAHLRTLDGEEGVSFAVFAPNAKAVSVVGDFNGWDAARHPLAAIGKSGIWEAFVPGVPKGAVYKYHIASRRDGYTVDKADPYGVRHEVPPRTGSIVWDLEYRWRDQKWMDARAEKQKASAPMSIYEVHLGSWRRVPEESNRPLTYREAAGSLAHYALEMGFTHVELLPVMEHPFAGSWGYQTTGYFAPTSRFGTPQDFMYLVDTLHQAGVGVILDWVPSHFPSDEHGLVYFDGTHLYEHADWRQGYHPDWKSCIFNYDRHEVRSFLLSSALYWLDRYHADGLRVDAVASMLRLDYSRKHGEWIPNAFGGNENLGAIGLLRRLNDEVGKALPGAVMFAEESTSWPMVSRPTYVGGLGFQMKWDLGWMNDTLDYMRLDPIFRRFHHNDLTFRRMYQYSENFVLPLSHDEVVHLKASLLSKMPGDEWQKFANLRLLFAYMWAQAGKKLLFMGGEIGQWKEWNHDTSLDWELLEFPRHGGLALWVRDLNRLHASEPALHQLDFDPRGFDWIDCHDSDHSVVSLVRRGDGPGEEIVAVFNFTPVPRHDYRVGVSRPGDWTEVANSDAEVYGGSGVGNQGRTVALEVPAHGRAYSLSLTLPPLGAVFLKAPPEEPAALSVIAVDVEVEEGEVANLDGGRFAGRMIESPTSRALVGASGAAETVRFVCIHGHFYQPPRENPWLEAIEGQPSAYPYHDWNERITAECYAPNANARILDAENRIIAIVNNYAAMSFNFGPTLLSWLDAEEPEVYRAILAADAESQVRFSGHGSALAQPYNHMILPLADARDRKTQVAWGIADFRARFGREPEGMWLPETAVDLDTLEALAAAGIRFTILSPHQASHVRRIGEEEWREPLEGGPDPTTPYRVALPSGGSIAVFFYDGPISRAVAFDRLLSRGDHLSDRLMGAFSAEREGPQLVHIATDGETFGHHHRHGDMALAYALRTIESAGLAKVTNYGEFLEKVPPRSEARIREKTSWSCAHGVERWRSDCGCQSGAHPGWNQAWRAPLREALDALRDALAPVWEERAGLLFADPWTARDAYIDVILDRSPERGRRFLEEHARRELSDAERVEAWKLLEIQRHAQLMYTSCGWFLDDIGGIEARQILAYAGRALQLANEALGRDFEPAVLEPLSRAASNVPETGDGRRIYEESVRPAAVSLQDVGAHYGVHALFAEYPALARVYCYRVAREALREFSSGRARLQLGRAKVTSEITGESASVAWGVLHLGDHNLSGGLLRSEEPGAFATAEKELEALFRRADLPEILRAVDRSFGRGDRYALRLLFRDEQQQVLAEILRAVLDEADAVYRRLYEEHAPLMRFLSSHGVAPPRGFRIAAEQALNTRLRRALEDPEPDVARLEAVLEEARNVGVTLHEDGLGRAFERTIDKMAAELRARPGDRDRLANLEGIVTLVKHLPFEVDFWKVQNAYYQMARTVLPGRRREADGGFQDAREWVERFLALGAGLAVKVEDASADPTPRV